MKNGIIYKAVSPSGKVYIGQTTRSLRVRKKQHVRDSKKYNYAFALAIKEYGIDNFIWVVLHKDVCVNKLNELEVLEIKNHNSFYNGYNCTEGGDFNPMDYECNRKKVSERTMGVKKSITYCGADNHASKLTDGQVKEIRRLYIDTKCSHKELCDVYNVSRKTIGNVIGNVCYYDKNYVPPDSDFKNKIKQSDASRIVYLVGNGTTATQLAKDYSVSIQTICNVLYKYGNPFIKDTLKKNQSRCKLSGIDVKNIIIRVNAGELIKDLAAEYNISIRTVSRRIAEYRKKNVGK